MRLWIKTWRRFFLFFVLEANVHDRYVFILYFCNQVPGVSSWDVRCESVMCKCVFFVLLCILYFYIYIMMRSHTEFPLDWKYGTCFVSYTLCNLFLLLLPFPSHFLSRFLFLELALWFFFLYSKIVSFFHSPENLSMSLGNFVKYTTVCVVLKENSGQFISDEMSLISCLSLLLLLKKK